jgi:predicted ATPase
LIANALNLQESDREIFVRVARGQLGLERLSRRSSQHPNLSPAQIVSHNNLPVLPTPLIGRQRELAEFQRLLCESECRMLTLVGAGGMGKTRLAIDAAALVQGSFADGVYFVPLAAINSARFLIAVIADAVGFAFQNTTRIDPKTQLLNYFQGKNILLVIDNIEHLLQEAGIEFFSELLACAPQIKLLVTSREPVNFQDEWVYEVEGLPFPREGFTEGTCLELFLQRARRANVGFSATTNDYPFILRICQLVDGNPLGIELAAAWVRTLSCEEITREIERGMDFLSLSTRDLPPRHRSMRAVFDHSWQLLKEEEQRVLLRLSAFRGGFRREAAEHVAEATLPVLSALVTKSLVRRNSSGRYDLHDVIGQFVADHFTERAEEQNATQARHGRYYLTYFSQADGRLRSSTQRETLAELTAEMDNFRVAWDWAVIHCEFGLIQQTLRTFFRLYDTRGWFQEGLETLDRALDALEKAHEHSLLDRSDQVALGHLLATRSWLAYRLANYEQARRMLERSLEILRPLHEPRVLVEALTYLGRVMEMTGNYARALELYAEGLEVATAIDDRWFKAVCFMLHTALVGLTHGTLRPEITHERLQSVVADWRLIGDPRLIAFALDFLSRSALRLKRYDEARAALEENIALNRSIGFGWGLGTAYRALGKVAQVQGEHQQAVNMFRKSLDIFTELGGNWFVARALAEMGESILALGNEDEARRVWLESLHIATEIHGTPVALEALAGFASLQAEQGNREHALELVLVVLNHPASLQVTKDRASALRVELEAQLSPIQIEVIQALAEEKSFEMVVGDLLK